MNRNLLQWMLAAIFAISGMTAYAQTDFAFSWGNYDRFPQLPPIHSGFDAAMMIHPQPNLLLMMSENKHDEVTDPHRHLR